MKRKNSKRIISCVLSLLVLLSIVPMMSVSAENKTGITADGFEYKIRNGEVTITGYTGSATELTIPSEIEGFSVTSLGDIAFLDCTTLESVLIPDSVTSISCQTFLGCLSLSEITVDPDNTTYDNRDNCNAIIETATNTLILGCKNTSIPLSVTSIGDFAFYNCKSLESVKIHESVTSIGRFAFAKCTSLADITIPGGIKSIGDYMFAGCTTLTSIIIPEGVTNIGDSAFHGCKNLTDIIIPENVTRIGAFSFHMCTSLTSVAIPACVTSIGDSAFGGCENLEIITFSPSVISIGSEAFFACPKIVKIILPEGAKSIGDRAFAGCTLLTSVTIPESVVNICDDVFMWCENLTDVYYSGTQEQWSMIAISADNEELSNATIHYNYVEPTEPSEKNFVTDAKTGISVALNTEAELVVSEITGSKEIADVDFILEGEKVVKMFDITLQKDGVEVQPESKVWVKIPVENSEAKVYRVEVDGTLTDMNAEYKDGYLEFTTEHFSIYVVAEPAVTYLLGDADGDEKVNVKDATLIQKSAAGIVSLEERQLTASDVNSDDKVNVKDATAIQKYAAGIETGFPIGEEKTA